MLNPTSENPLHHRAFDFFRRKDGVNIDWVKQQVYGVNPDVFPPDVSSLEGIVQRIPCE